MKVFVNSLLLAGLSSAFVLPSEEVLSQLAIEDHHESSIQSFFDSATSVKDEVLTEFSKHFDEVTETSKSAWEDVSEGAKSLMDEAFERASNAAHDLEHKADRFATDLEQAWIDEQDGGHHGGHHGHDGGHHGGHHGPPHHHEPNMTIYQLIAGNKYTTTLAKVISKYDDLVAALNTTKANFTVFAPTDEAFKKLRGAPKLSEEELKAVLQYHVIPDFYPAGRVLSSHTAPTLLKGEHLSSEPEPQRITFNLGLRGLTVNRYARIFPINIFATNGVIHGVDSVILPPPKIIALVDLFPGEFSTLELGLGKTGLLEKLNTTDHPGGTLFAPSNFAFKKLGPRINAFLFSQAGLKYLKGLLEYHVVPGTTLYSDAIYQAKSSDVEAMKELPSKGRFHIDLPTFLKDRSLSVDVGRYGGFISIKINGFANVVVQDGVAQDGVIQVVGDVLIPPKKIGGASEHWDGSELTVEDLMERLEPYVSKQDL